MKINLDVLKRIYEDMIKSDNIYYLNEYVGLTEDETATFEQFKEFVKDLIYSNLQYDFNVDTNGLIEEDR